MRLLLSVGCNNYDYAGNLGGAENDARSIFDALVGGETHQYDSRRSMLLLSPTSEGFRRALGEALYKHGDASVFSMYFAGHGLVFDEALYLGTSDINPSQIALTGIAFTELLRAVLSARLKQANFVLDACNTGGLGFDLAAILKRTIIGAANTTGVSFVAAAAAEEIAFETSAGGAFTVRFAKIIRGQTYIQRAEPFLNLAEIAQHLQTHEPISNQTISAWGLNLQGPNLFAKNPFYSGPDSVADSFVSKLHRNSLSKAEQIRLRAALASLTTQFSERELASAIETGVSRIDGSERAELLFGLIEGLRPELSGAGDAFLEGRVSSVFLGQLLTIDQTPDTEKLIANLVYSLIKSIRRALTQLLSALASNKYALIEEPISDLYYLPIRVADVLGQAGLLLLAQDQASSCDIKLVAECISQILESYGNTIVALSDDQACGFLIFLAACERQGWQDWAEEVTGRLFHDLDLKFGRVAGNNLDAHNQVRVLDERYKQIEKPDIDIYDTPSDLVTVIFVYSALLRLDEAIDRCLINLDHTNINFFLPDKIASFGHSDKIVGTNYSLSLGHDFWRCIDLRRILGADIFPMFDEASRPLSHSARVAVLASSLTFHDRLPWNCW